MPRGLEQQYLNFAIQNTLALGDSTILTREHVHVGSTYVASLMHVSHNTRSSPRFTTAPVKKAWETGKDLLPPSTYMHPSADTSPSKCLSISGALIPLVRYAAHSAVLRPLLPLVPSPAQKLRLGISPPAAAMDAAINTSNAAVLLKHGAEQKQGSAGQCRAGPGRADGGKVGGGNTWAQKVHSVQISRKNVHACTRIG